MKIRRIFTTLIVFLIVIIIGHLALNCFLETRRQLSELERNVSAAFSTITLEMKRELAGVEQILPLLIHPDYAETERRAFNVRFLAVEENGALKTIRGRIPEFNERIPLTEEWTPLPDSAGRFIMTKKAAASGGVYILGVEPDLRQLVDRMPFRQGAHFLVTDLQGSILWERPAKFYSGDGEQGVLNLQERLSGWYAGPSGRSYWGRGITAFSGQMKMYILYPLRHILWLLFSRLSITAALELFLITVMGAIGFLVSRYVLDPMDRVSRLAVKMQDSLFCSTSSQDLAKTVHRVACGIREINAHSRVREVRVFCQTLSSALQSYVFQQEKLNAGSEELAGLNKSLSRANEALITRDRIWRRVLDVSRSVTMDSGFPRGLAVIAESLRDVAGAYGVLIGKLDNDQVGIFAGSGFGKRYAGENVPVAFDTIGKSLQEGCPIWLENVHLKGDCVPLDPEIRSEVNIPMFHMGKAVGILTIAWRTVRREDRELMDVLIPIATHIGGMLNTHAALQELRESYQYLTARMQNLTSIYHDETAEHLERMEQYCRFIGTAMGLPAARVEDVALFSRIHDIGKLRVPMEILSKNGPLEKEEFETVKGHTVWGAEIIGDASWLEVGRKICLYHHEKWDGTGYPYGISGGDIPLEARIVALADTYDALRMERSYKEAFSHETACSIILGGDGRVMPSHFDPEIMGIFEKHETRMQGIYESSLGVS